MGISRNIIKCVALSTIGWTGTAFAAAPQDINGVNRDLAVWLDVLDSDPTVQYEISNDNRTDLGTSTGDWPFAAGAQVAGSSADSVRNKTSNFASFVGTGNVYSASGGINFSNATQVLQRVGDMGLTSTSVSVLAVASTGSNTTDGGPLYEAIANGSVRMSATLARANSLPPQFIYGGTTVNLINSTPHTISPYAYAYRKGTGYHEVYSSYSAEAAQLNANFIEYGAAANLQIGGNRFKRHPGELWEIMIFNRTLFDVETTILMAYLSAKHGLDGRTYRYHLGGIGTQIDVSGSKSVSRGTSAGMAITPLSPSGLAVDVFVTATVKDLNPPRGYESTDLPTGYSRRAKRVWQVVGDNWSDINYWFNLKALGFPATAGRKLALLYRATETGNFTVAATANTPDDLQVSFLSKAKTGFYTIGQPEPDVKVASSEATPITAGEQFPKVVPGALIRQTITGSNEGVAPPDADTVVVDIPIPAAMDFYLGDIGAAGSGPVTFTNGTVSSGLSYTYTALDSTTDGLEFSNDSGATWTYTPVPRSNKADTSINRVRVKLPGTFADGTSPNFPSFKITYGLLVR